MTKRNVLEREALAIFDQKAKEESEVTESRHREIIASVWLGSTDAIE